MINVGFIGLGNMARMQISSFKPLRGCRLWAGADPSEAARALTAERFPGMTLYGDHREMLADREIDAIVVATPTLYHKATAIDAMRAGKPVMTEKPMARTVADCRRMIEASKQTGQLLMVAHCRRFDSIWGAWGKAVVEGRIGAPVMWRDVSAGVNGGWFMDDRIGGGPLIDGAVHNYDFANMMWGDPLNVVASSIKLNEEVTAVDTGTAVVEYGGGNKLMMSWSWAVRGTRLFDVLGSRGSIATGTGSLKPPANAGQGQSFYCLTDGGGREKLIRTRGRSGDMYRKQARHFLACVAGKEECISPGTEAIKAVAVAEAVLKAGPRGGARKVTW